MSERITQKGEVQEDSSGFSIDIERRFRWLFGLESPLRSAIGRSSATRLGSAFSSAPLVASRSLDPPGDGRRFGWPLGARFSRFPRRDAKRPADLARSRVSFVPPDRPGSRDLRTLCRDHRERRQPALRLPRALRALAYLDFLPLDRRWLCWRSRDSSSIRRVAWLWAVVAAVACATIVEQVGDLALGSVAARLRGMASERSQKFERSLRRVAALRSDDGALVYACREVSTWSVVLFLFPAFAAQKFFLLYREQRATSEELAVAMEQQERANLSFATALVATLDARDRYTAGHSAAVAVYARDIAERLGLPERRSAPCSPRWTCTRHRQDRASAGLLEKPRSADSRRARADGGHPVIGERILLK